MTHPSRLLAFGLMRILDGFFILQEYLIKGACMGKYNKPPLTLSAQVDLLVSRGLSIQDREDAEKFLSQVSYYRFSAYCVPFEVFRHKFKPNVTFEQIQQLYEFDRRLRFLIDEALEIIEIALRTAAVYHLSQKYGPFMHEDATKFYKGFNHSEWIAKVREDIERSKETFITHYKNKYEGFPSIPLWMAVEIMSFSALSKLIHNLLREDQKTISRIFGLHHTVLSSWLHTFAYIRNICAHHGRLWNRELAIAMIIPKDRSWQGVDAKRAMSVIFAINQFLSKLPYGDHIKDLWRQEIEELFHTKIEGIDICAAMGIETDLNTHPLWQIG